MSYDTWKNKKPGIAKKTKVKQMIDFSKLPVMDNVLSSVHAHVVRQKSQDKSVHADIERQNSLE